MPLRSTVRLRPQDIPLGLEDITASWLTAALGSDLMGQSDVSEISVEVIGAGRGHLGSSFRATLRYHTRPPGAPESVVVKLPALTAESREVAERGRLYEREVRFFVELADGVEAGAPRCFAAGYDPFSDRFALVLEDVSGRNHVDQLSGCPVDLAEVSLRQLARTHARWWNDKRLADLSWLTPFSDPKRLDNLATVFRAGWPLLCQDSGDRVGRQAGRIGDAVAEFLPEAMAHLDQLPQTLLHGDPRLDNLMFDAGAARAPVVLLDWQNVSRGAAVSDVCYFLVQNLSLDDFHLHRLDLLAAYHEELAAAGVSDVCLSELVAALPLALPVSIAVAAALFVVGDQDEPRTRELGVVMAERALFAARETGLLGLINTE